MKRAAALLLAVLAGCAHVPEDAGFPDVERIVVDRTGTQVRWRRGGQGDKAIEAIVVARLGPAMSPEDAVQVALVNNRSLQATYEELGIAQAAVVQAGLPRNPKLTVEVLFGGGADLVGLDLVFQILDILYVPLRRHIAEGRFEAVKRRVAAEALATAARTRIATIDLLAATERIALLRAALESREASAGAMERLAGAPLLDIEREHDARDRAKLDLAKAEADATAARERLNRLMGLWGAQADGWALAGDLPDPPGEPMPGEALEKRVLEANLELAAMTLDIDALGAEAGVARWAADIPDVETGVRAQRDEDRDWFVGPLVGSTYAFPIPIFDQGQPRKFAAEARLRRAMEERWARAVEIRSLARAAWARAESARQRVRFLRSEVLPRRRRIADESQREFDAGRRGAFERRDALRGRDEAEVEEVEALREYWTARAELELMLAGVAAME